MQIKSNSVLEGLFDGNNKIIFAVDRNYNYLAFNKRYNDAIKERSGAEVRIGDHARPFFKEQTDQELESQFDRAMSGESFILRDERVKPRKGGHTYEFYFYPIRSGEEITGAALEITDVTELTALRRQTRVFESRYRAFVDMMPDLISLVSPKGRIEFANDAFLKFFQGRIGMEIRDFIPPSRRIQFIEQLEKIDRNHPTFTGTFLVTHFEGKKRWMNWNVTGIFDENGSLEEILLVGRNVDRMKRAELQKDRQVHDLEKLVLHRSARVVAPI